MFVDLERRNDKFRGNAHFSIQSHCHVYPHLSPNQQLPILSNASSSKLSGLSFYVFYDDLPFFGWFE